MSLDLIFHWDDHLASSPRCRFTIIILTLYHFSELSSLFHAFYHFWMNLHTSIHLPKDTLLNQISYHFNTLLHKYLYCLLKISKYPYHCACHSWINLSKLSHWTNNRHLSHGIYQKYTILDICPLFWSIQCRCHFLVPFQRSLNRVKKGWGLIFQNHPFYYLSIRPHTSVRIHRFVSLSHVCFHLRIDQYKWYLYWSYYKP